MGTEVAAGRAVLDALVEASGGVLAFDWTEFPWGCGYYEKTRDVGGTASTDEVVAAVIEHLT
ncbi:hypothetical protein MOQ72_38880 [Saccharopolyspora sp. K220]|uniref:hypothetical protein n=1 Tax=Saccharopolyspora soli TaxID=2926618 RepID=UPI001F55FA8A|nr:hypothetical protein [Saccharopolyspora soli]MCI2423398.1 hypothetical protein [Saccharopolyspora soli]